MSAPPAPGRAAPGAPLQIVVMGVSGCGKSTVGALIAQALGLDFVEGDALHPPANVAKMAAGTPLTDADRAGWLAAIAGLLQRAAAGSQGLVVSCSALKRSYRERLRAACPGLRLVHLHGTPAQLAARLQGRSGHYMPASLLDSQLATLEPPAADERALVFDIALPAQQIAAAALAGLGAAAPAATAPSAPSAPSAPPAPSAPSPQPVPPGPSSNPAG